MGYMNKFIYHDYDKKSKTCRVCGREFKVKPKADNCPGVPIRNRETEEAPQSILEKINRKLKDKAIPVAYEDGKNYKRSKQRDETCYLYSFSDTEIIDPTLPAAYNTVSDIPKEQKPISEKVMRTKGLEPKENAKPIAVIRKSGKKHLSDEYYLYWEYYYNEDETQLGDGLNYITKGRLKSEYCLSDSWVKKLGEPDVKRVNPHFKCSHPMQLYKIARVRDFLKANAEEYAEWLVKREQLVINSRHLAESSKRKAVYRRELSKANAPETLIAEKNEKKLHQNVLCLKCQASTFLNNGIFCAIYPMGLPDGVPENYYCPDFT